MYENKKYKKECKLNRITENKLFMNVAQLFSKRSTCIRKQVGCVLINNGRIVSTGYNGVISGKKHCYEYFLDYYSSNNFLKNKYSFDEWITTKEFYDMHGSFSKLNEIHAEQNVIKFVAKYKLDINDSILYTTLSPCCSCAKLIVDSGIKKVIYLERYDRNVSGINFLNESGVECVQYNVE